MKRSEVFLNRPLVFWLRDCVSGELPLIDEVGWNSEHFDSCQIQDDELFDGFLMSCLMNYIDPNFGFKKPYITRIESSREEQFRHLLLGVFKFYETNLDQLVVIDLPDLKDLTGATNNDKFVEGIEKVILLILGCAVQSDKKKLFIDRITRFQNHIQSALAEYIQQLTEGTSILCGIHTDKGAVFKLFKRLMKEKYAPIERSRKYNDSDDGSSNTASSSNDEECSKISDNTYNGRPTSPNSEIRQLTLHVARLSHENRQLRTQSECKDDECRKQEEELEEKTKRVATLENERLRLLTKDKQVKELEDDLQAARLRIEKLQSLESLEGKYRRAEEEKSFFESKYKAIEKRNKSLDDVITELEKTNKALQIENNDRKTVENSLQRMRTTVSNQEKEIATKNSEIEVLLDEKHRLETELKEREERIMHLETSSCSLTPRHVYSLANQLEDANKDELEIMKAEVRKLRAQTEGAFQGSEIKDALLEMEQLKKQLLAEELQNSQSTTELQKMKLEREEIDRNMEKIVIELEETSVQVEKLRGERDDAVTGLHEARRKFSQFQLDFGKTLEEEFDSKHRKLQSELSNLRKDLITSQETQQETGNLVEKFKNENRKLSLELDEVREEKDRMEITINQLERNRKKFDTEKEMFKKQIAILEDSIESLKLQLIANETSQKRLNERDSTIECLHDEKSALENELRIVQQHLKIESKKTQSLREDLVLEKSRKADLIGTLRSLCTSLRLNGGIVDVDGMDDEELINKIDDIMMNALVAVKRESDALRIQQNMQIAELSDLKRDIEKLRRSESQSLNESDDRVRELTLENIQTKEQVYILQEKLRELNLELSARCNEIEIAKKSIEELHKNSALVCASNAELAKLQVAIRNSEIQEDIAKQESASLREELQTVEKLSKEKMKSLDELEAMHKSLLADHSRLQHLHNLLTRDYDEVKTEHVASKHKLHNVEKQLKNMFAVNIQELESTLAEEITKGEKQSKVYLKLYKDHQLCSVEIEKLRCDISNADKNFNEIRNELLRVNETNVIQYNTLNTVKQQLSSKEVETSTLQEKVEALTQLNQTFHEENKNLSRQLEILLTQNKELLQRALYDKDQYHLEMTDYQDQLSALRRHKEKLEEKIMDQYRAMENKRPTERKQPLVKRAAKAFINRRRVASNGGSTTEDSSVYSADECASSPVADDHDNIPPTCSSSDDHDISPPSSGLYKCSLRFRNDISGESQKFLTPKNPLKTAANDLALSSECPAVLTSRTPLRNKFSTSSLRTRPPPPPYDLTKKNKSPRSQDPKVSLNATVNHCSNSQVSCVPPCSTTEQKKVVMEGERRDSVRDKIERSDKTLSFYENVNTFSDGKEHISNESTVWYEYGCV